MSQLKDSQKEREFSLSPTFCSIQNSSGLDEAGPQWGRMICFTQSTNSNANLGTSLAVQWLRLRASTAGARV